MNTKYFFMKFTRVFLVTTLVVVCDQNQSQQDKTNSLNKQPFSEDCYEDLVKQAISEQVCLADDKNCISILKSLAYCAKHCEQKSNKNELKSVACFIKNCGSDHQQFQNFIKELYTCFSPNIHMNIPLSTNIAGFLFLCRNYQEQSDKQQFENMYDDQLHNFCTKHYFLIHDNKPFYEEIIIEFQDIQTYLLNLISESSNIQEKTFQIVLVRAQKEFLFTKSSTKLIEKMQTSELKDKLYEYLSLNLQITNFYKHLYNEMQNNPRQIIYDLYDNY
ncbi:hypothetical protein ABPG72_012432 [Tetrahymena utriculariae]